MNWNGINVKRNLTTYSSWGLFRVTHFSIFVFSKKLTLVIIITLTLTNYLIEINQIETAINILNVLGCIEKKNVSVKRVHGQTSSLALMLSR